MEGEGEGGGTDGGREGERDTSSYIVLTILYLYIRHSLYILVFLYIYVQAKMQIKPSLSFNTDYL